MNLTDLPPEVLLSVFLYLKTKFVLTTLTKVCKLFYSLIKSESTWKARFWKLWPNRTTNGDSHFIARLGNVIHCDSFICLLIKCFLLVKLFQ